MDVQSTGPCQAEIKDLSLTLTTAYGDKTFDLSTKTISQLVADISASNFGTPGIFSAAIADQSRKDFFARGLLETSKQELADSHFLYPTSPLYNEFQTYGWILQEQADRLGDAASQLSPVSATDSWLDYWWQGHFGIKRYQGETDATYVLRAAKQLVRPTQNNIALSNILKDALGVTANIVDAYPILGGADNLGRFLLDLKIPNELSPTDAQTLIDRCKDIVRTYKAAGTDFSMQFVIKSQSPVETLTVGELLISTVIAAISDQLVPGPIQVGAGWKVGTPGLKVGNNDAIKEQALIQKITIADGTVVSSTLSGG